MTPAGTREHALSSHACWCQPRVEQACSVCPCHAPHPACERCAGTGWEAAYDPTACWVIVHNDVECV